MSTWYCYTCEQPFTLQEGIPFCSNCGATSIVELPDQSQQPGDQSQQPGDQSQQPGLLGWIFNTAQETISQLANTYFNQGSSYDHYHHHHHHHHHGNENNGLGMDVNVSPQVESFGEVVATTNDDDPNGGGGGSSSGTPASQAVIDSLPVIKVSRIDLSLNPHCTFCMEKFEREARAKKLPCKHIFHSQCIDPWLGRANTCPVCRQEVKFVPQGSDRVDTQSSSQVGTGRSHRAETYCPHHSHSRWSRLWRFH